MLRWNLKMTGYSHQFPFLCRFSSPSKSKPEAKCAKLASLLILVFAAAGESSSAILDTLKIVEREEHPCTLVLHRTNIEKQLFEVTFQSKSKCCLIINLDTYFEFTETAPRDPNPWPCPLKKCLDKSRRDQDQEPVSLLDCSDFGNNGKGENVIKMLKNDSFPYCRCPMFPGC